MAITDIEEGRNEPRIVKLRRRKHSFGFKVRGQVNEGGPRWLIDGKEYRNLQTVSEVYAESAADDGGVQPGDKILSINGIEVEGIEHERFKELMKSSGDEVELVVLTPRDAKMLDIPLSVTIHRSDGSILNINDPDVLRSQNIDQAIMQEKEKAANVGAKAHSTVVEIDSLKDLAAEEESHVTDAENISNKGDDTDKVYEEDESKNKDEFNVSIEIPEEPEPVDQIAETSQDSAAESETEESTINDKELEENSIITENSMTIVNIDEEEELGVAETSFTESSLDPGDLKEISDNIRSNCTSGQEIESTDNTSFRKQGKLRKKRLLPKRPNRRQFSPDTFNDLSPYYSRIKINTIEIKQRPTHSWKYHQRPTSLSVLHPSDALRLERSSNLGRRKKASSEVEMDDKMSRLRCDVYDIYRNVELRSKLLRTSQGRMTSLSHQQYTSPHTKQTLNT